MVTGVVVSCTQPVNGLEIGETATYPTEATDAVLRMEVTSAEFATECPDRAEPGTTQAGEFLFLTVKVQVGEPATAPEGLTVLDGEIIVSTSPERFEAFDHDNTRVGGFDPELSWVCFSDDELLPMLMTSGMEAEGRVVLAVQDKVDYVEFLVTDDQRFRWAVTR